MVSTWVELTGLALSAGVGVGLVAAVVGAALRMSPGGGGE